MTAEPTIDRRRRRRLETIEEVLDVAVEVMGEQGVAGLSIGEVARRMGIRPPSLYVYFDNKHALYDALFERGAQSVLDGAEAAVAALDRSAPVEAQLLDLATAFVRWAVEHPAYSQLLFWRPVPGYAPSAAAYAPAVRLVELSLEQLAGLQQAGLLRADVPAEEVLRSWTVLISGVVTQQLANGPDEPFESGTFAAALPAVVAMFARHYAPDQASSPTRRRRHADQRRPDR